MSIQILYGVVGQYVDITEIAKRFCYDNSTIIIPKGDDNRSRLFADPCYGKTKHICITQDDVKTLYDANTEIHYKVKFPDFESLDETTCERLSKLHKKLKLENGSLDEEYPEQLMATTFIPPNAKVLEIGANIGRNTCIIASLLDDSSNLVTLETDITNIPILEKNRDINDLKFQIEGSALSKRKLIQRHWDTVPSDILYDGWTSVNTITWTDLQSKFNIQFDTLVADCEGALYWIIQDEPEFLSSFKLILIENDYKNPEHKVYVNQKYIENGFKRLLAVPYMWSEYYSNFYEAWIKE
jgi:FkbM family methyltransferase